MVNRRNVSCQTRDPDDDDDDRFIKTLNSAIPLCILSTTTVCRSSAELFVPYGQERPSFSYVYVNCKHVT